MKLLSSCIFSELEGRLLKEADPFCYYMLVAFEASGLIRFALLLMLWPLIRLLQLCGRGDSGLKLTIFVATAGLKVSEIEAVGRAVLPKFYYDDIDMEAWRTFISFDKKRVVVTKTPTIMVERFVLHHLGAHLVIGPQLAINRFGRATGFVKTDIDSIFTANDQPNLALSTPDSALKKPIPVIFHDGRLVKRPTPFTALLILCWIPMGIVVAAIRIVVGLILPIWIIPTVAPLFGGKVIVKGKPPQYHSKSGGVLFVCTHRTLMDPVVLSAVLQRKIPAVTYSLSRLSELLSPIPTVRLTRTRDMDAEKIKQQLQKGDLVACPEGTTCREPFLLRFSALFAELTDRIVPVAMNYEVGFFHGTTARGWKAMDPIFFLMNPRPVYEITFLNQLPAEETCASGKSPHDVANYVQRILASALGFECTNFTRKDKYRVLAGNDGMVSHNATFKQLLRTFNPFIH